MPPPQLIGRGSEHGSLSSAGGSARGSARSSASQLGPLPMAGAGSQALAGSAGSTDLSKPPPGFADGQSRRAGQGRVSDCMSR